MYSMAYKEMDDKWLRNVLKIHIKLEMKSNHPNSESKCFQLLYTISYSLLLQLCTEIQKVSTLPFFFY